MNFYEAMDYTGFDIDRAVQLTTGENPVDYNVIEEILKEAGLDAVASVSTKPCAACDR